MILWDRRMRVPIDRRTEWRCRHDAESSRLFWVILFDGVLLSWVMLCVLTILLAGR